MRMITTSGELNQELAKVREAGSDAARREQFLTFAMALPEDFPADPDSPEYRRRQLDLYAEIAGKPYAVANERTLFDAASMADKPFPYLNEGWEVTGDQLIAIGWLFKAMKLNPKASVLEFGAGWGNTTLALAQNGHQVSVVEIEANFVDLIRERARRLNLSINVHQGDFLEARNLGRAFDAVLFFESFHHCARHDELFDLLPDLLNPDGIVVFGAEPIDENFRYPWSLRLDGQSLWAIRANGWLELGFSESYFIRSLMLRGFLVDKLQSSASPLANCLVARRANGHYPLTTFYMPPAEDRTWASAETDPTLRQRFTGANSELTLQKGGPFTSLQIETRNYAPIDLPVEVTFGSTAIREVIPAHTAQTLTLPYDRAVGTLVIRTETWRPTDYPGISDDGRTLGLSISAIDLV